MKKCKKILALLLSVLMVVMVVPLSGSVLEASALEKLDVLLWSSDSLPGGTLSNANEVETMYNNLALNCFASYGKYSLSKINQMYDLSELGFIMVYLPT